jgi:hypothetical protein
MNNSSIPQEEEEEEEGEDVYKAQRTGVCYFFWRYSQACVRITFAVREENLDEF